MSDKELERAQALEAKEREQQEQQQAAEFSESMEKVENVLTSSEAFIENNKKPLLIVLGAVIVVVLGLIWFLKSHNEKKAEANDAIYKAQSWFERDSFQLALSGNDDFIGFEEVADKYSSTPAGNLACAYAGICYKNLGKNDEAIKYLKKFSADDNLVSPAIYGAIGDCYFESNSIKDAESYYKKAIDSKNNMIAPLYTYRLAMLYFNNGDNAKAAELMEKLKDDYPQSNEASDADKYIEYFQNLKK
ncbi:MAG: tetratricopeptide repeat protein [Bacteroidales bacterium]|jgi:tetratricopeptide (TPR) repeat protein|nr:tetratricopeptide repeat protein [Paludibacteraceae bacterium]MDD5996602.1 tetratricopeptide repeat protein [Bacteroidales bacterium]